MAPRRPPPDTVRMSCLYSRQLPLCAPPGLCSLFLCLLFLHVTNRIHHLLVAPFVQTCAHGVRIIRIALSLLTHEEIHALIIPEIQFERDGPANLDHRHSSCGLCAVHGLAVGSEDQADTFGADNAASRVSLNASTCRRERKIPIVPIWINGPFSSPKSILSFRSSPPQCA